MGEKNDSKQIAKPKNDNGHKPSYENWACAVKHGRCKVSYEQYLKNGIVYGPS